MSDEVFVRSPENAPLGLLDAAGEAFLEPAVDPDPGGRERHGGHPSTSSGNDLPDRSINAEADATIVRPVQFAAFGHGGSAPRADQSNLSLLMDVALKVTVELGRAHMAIKDVLALGPGSIIELDKLAGEPVDIIVNGVCIAHGEVVVVDENFGVRVTEIVAPVRRTAVS